MGREYFPLTLPRSCGAVFLCTFQPKHPETKIEATNLYKKLCQVVEGSRHDSYTVRPQSENLDTLDHRNCRNISASETESSE